MPRVKQQRNRKAFRLEGAQQADLAIDEAGLTVLIARERGPRSRPCDPGLMLASAAWCECAGKLARLGGRRTRPHL